MLSGLNREPNMTIPTHTDQPNYLSEDPLVFPDFKMQVEVAVCFLEYNQQILVLKRSKKEDQSFTWCIPGGKVDPQDGDPKLALARELFEEIGLTFQASDFTWKAKRYARIPGWDYILHIFHRHLSSKPSIRLSDEHIRARWIPVNRFTGLNLLKGQEEAFKIVYQDQVR